MLVVAFLFALVALTVAVLIVLLVVNSRKIAKQKAQARGEQQAARVAAMMDPNPPGPVTQSFGQAGRMLGAQAAEAGRLAAQGGGAGLFKDMPSGDAMYAMSFPDIAPLFKPEGLLAWHAWYRERHRTRQIIRDGRRWRGEVPGFAQAAAMMVLGEKTAEPVLPVTDTVTLQDASDVVLTEMRTELRADGSATVTVPQGRFTLTPEDAECKVRFEGEAKGKARSFEWKGPGQWRINAAQGMPRVQTRDDDDDLDWDDRFSSNGFSVSSYGSSSSSPSTTQTAAAVLLAEQQMAAQSHEQMHTPDAAANLPDLLPGTALEPSVTHGVSGDSFSDNDNVPGASGTSDAARDSSDALQTDY